MNQYLSLIFLYSSAGYKKVLLVAGVIPLCFLIIFYLKSVIQIWQALIC